VRNKPFSRAWVDLLIGPGVIALVMAFSLLVPVRAQAQVNMTLSQLMPNLVRNTSQVVTASSAGLQVAEAGSVAIGSGGSALGSIAINELRVIPLARIAARAVTSASVVGLGMLAVDLISYGVKQCQTSGTGWCGPPVSPHSGDVGFSGKGWNATMGSGPTASAATGDSPDSACSAVFSIFQGKSPNFANYRYIGLYQVSASQYLCQVTYGSGNDDLNGTVNQQTSCISGYIVSGTSCVVDPNAPPAAYSYPQLSPLLAQALTGNPNRAKDYWGIMSPADWYTELGQPTTQALPAQVPSAPGNSITGPRRSVLSPSGTTTTVTTWTVTPNTDALTLGSKPVVVTQTDVTTNPDNTTSTTTTTVTPTTQDGSNPQAPAQPAQQPLPCGLGIAGSPKCQMDETGTPTKTDATTAMASPATDLQTAEQTGETQLSNATKGLSWSLTMPHILPGGSCVPIEWFSWGTWRASWDVCTQLQYVHDLLAWLWPVCAAVYVWNKAAGANAGVV